MARILFTAVLLAWLSSTAVTQTTVFHRLSHHGRVLEYALILPDRFDKTTCYPVLLALPPGDQSKQLVMAGLHLYWEAQAKRRGWVVISPAAPEGTNFYSGAESELTNLLDEVSRSVVFEGGKVHLAGVSNGGLSAYRIITEYPARFLSLTVLPGVPPDERAFNRLGGLKGIPVAAFVGGEDSEWVRGSQETKQKLDDLGIENTLEVVAGAGHVVPLDPVKLFDLLDRHRPKNADFNAR
jgi:poly(3-hydroxybutyrate) depolymerase